MELIHKGIITLLCSAVTGRSLELPQGFTLEDAKATIKKQGITTLIYQGAVNCGISPQEPLMQRYFQVYLRSMLHSERQMAAADKLFRAFEEHGIEYLPLKGCIMKHLYPKPELRPMGDADILIREDQYGAVVPIMESLGFTLKKEDDHTYNWASRDLYVELHKSVVPQSEQNSFAYYGSGWKFAKPETTLRYTYSHEDAFIYMFTHFTKHYRNTGIGCRHVADFYVYRSAYLTLDEGYICGEMEKLGILKFYENMLRLLDVWFGDAPANEVTELITQHIFSGGAWGTFENSVISHAIKQSRQRGEVKHSRWKAAFSAVFLSPSKMRLKYPILQNYPFLLPVMWVRWWIDVLVSRPRRIKRKLKELEAVNDASMSEYEDNLRRVGLDFGASETIK